MGAVVDVKEGQAEIVEVLKYLGDGRYLVRCVVLSTGKECEREIDIERRPLEK